MRRIRLIAATLFVMVMIAMLAGVSLAQARPGTAPAKPVATPSPGQTLNNTTLPATRIAIVDTSVFGDEKAGIVRYIAALKTVEREFEPRQAELNALQSRIKTVIDEFGKLNAKPDVDQKVLQAKRDEGERLELDFKSKKDQADAAFAKRYEEVVGPVSAEIGKALDQFTQARGITLTLDISKMMPAILTVNPAMDITHAFIADFNSKNPAAATPAKP